MTTIPHDTFAEESVVASCLVDIEAIVAVHATGITVDDFFHSRCAATYWAIRVIAEREPGRVYRVNGHWLDAVNQVTVAHELARVPAGNVTRLDEIGGAAWLSRIIAELPCSIGAEWYAGIVIDLAQRRRALAVGNQIAVLAQRGGSGMMSKAKTLVDSVAELHPDRAVTNRQRVPTPPRRTIGL